MTFTSRFISGGPLAARLPARRHRLAWLGVPAVGGLLAAGLLGTAPAAAAAAAPAGVTLAQVGNELLVAGQAGNHQELLWMQTVGSSSWSGSAVTSPGTVYSQASITTLSYGFGIRRVTVAAMVAEGPNDTLNFWWQDLGDLATPWHQEVLGGSGTDVAMPSIAQVGGDVAVVSEGDSQDLNLFWQQISGTTWNASYDEWDGLVWSDPSIAALTSAPSTLGMTFNGSTGFTFYLQQTAANLGHGWEQGEYAVGASGAPANRARTDTITALDGGATEITTRGEDDSVYYWASTTPLGLAPSAAESFPGTVDSNVSVAQLGNGIVAAAAEGVHENAHFYWRLNSGGAWHIENVGTPGTDLTGPEVIPLVNSTGTKMVAMVTEGGNYIADFYWQLLGSSTWHTEALWFGA